MEYALVAICVLLVLLPPKWDPAIRLKERHNLTASQTKGEGMQ